MKAVASALAPGRASDLAEDSVGRGASRSPRAKLMHRATIATAAGLDLGRAGLDEPTPSSASAAKPSSLPCTPRRWTIDTSTPKATPVRQFSGTRASGSSPGRGVSTERRFSADAKGDVTLCVRLRPGPHPEACVVVEPKDSLAADSKDCVRLRAATAVGSPGAVAGRYDACEVLYRCDHAFGPECPQGQVYSKAVTPIVEAVIRGYNGAVIAYGQTGAGKTHTMVGTRTPDGQGVAPRAVADIFAALEEKASWMVAVSALEIYNERVRDLLSPNGATAVEIHEVCADDQRQSFRCPDATMWPARSPDEALAALAEIVRRRETASTEMNDRSSRSHLVFTVCVWQGDPEESTSLHSRLHLVDLAGSERLKRSFTAAAPEHSPGASTPGTPLSARPSLRGSGSTTPSSLRSPRNSLAGTSRPSSTTGQQRPRDQRREAVDINKSLSQLALVIQRLTMSGPPQYVPYRDSMLTRLLAESFGGSSKTCLIIACSPFMEDREETRSSLDFGRRAKLVRNKPRINIETKEKPAAVVKAFMTGEFPGVQALPRGREQPASTAGRPPALAAEECEDRRAPEEREELELPLHQSRPAPVQPAPAVVDLCSTREQAAHSIDLTLLLPRPLSESCSGVDAQDAEDSRLREARAEAAEARAEAAELRRQLEAEAAEKRQLQVRLAALLEEGSAMPCTSSRRAAEEALRLEEEKAGAMAKFEEQCLALRYGWKDDVARLEQEKAAAAKRLRASLTRRWQEEACQMQELQAASLARLESEKATLRGEWQDAMEEVQSLHRQQAATEARLAEALADAERAPSARPAWPEAPVAPREAAAEAALHRLFASPGASPLAAGAASPEAAGEACACSCGGTTPKASGEATPSTFTGGERSEESEGLCASGPPAKRICWEPEAPTPCARQGTGAETLTERSLEQVLYGAKAEIFGADVAAGTGGAAACGAGSGAAAGCTPVNDDARAAAD